MFAEMSHGRGSTATGHLWLAALASALFAFLLPSARQALAQDTKTISQTVTVTSEPPGATVWLKVGTSLTCTNVLTPGAVEFKFHGPNDLQRIRLRKFGYVGQNRDVKPTDDKLNAALGDPAPNSFLAGDDAKPELKQLNAALETEFDKTIFADADAFRCAPFELAFVHVMDDEDDLTLGVVIILDRSFGGTAFRLASHTGTREERPRKVAHAALEGGVADLFARLHRIAAKFQNLKTVTVVCTYPSSEAYLDTDTVHWTRAEIRVGTRLAPVFNSATGSIEMKYTTAPGFDIVSGSTEVTEVKDRDVEMVLKLVMPAAQLPDTPDKKSITDAVLAKGKISLAKSQ